MSKRSLSLAVAFSFILVSTSLQLVQAKPPAGFSAPTDRSGNAIRGRHPNMRGAWTGTCSGEDKMGKFEFPFDINFISDMPQESAFSRNKGVSGSWALFFPLEVKYYPPKGKYASGYVRPDGTSVPSNPVISVCDDPECGTQDYYDLGNYGIYATGKWPEGTIHYFGANAYAIQSLTFIATPNADHTEFTGDCTWSNLTGHTMNWKDSYAAERVSRKGKVKFVQDK